MCLSVSAVPLLHVELLTRQRAAATVEFQGVGVVHATEATEAGMHGHATNGRRVCETTRSVTVQSDEYIRSPGTSDVASRWGGDGGQAEQDVGLLALRRSRTGATSQSAAMHGPDSSAAWFRAVGASRHVRGPALSLSVRVSRAGTRRWTRLPKGDEQRTDVSTRVAWQGRVFVRSCVLFGEMRMRGGETFQTR